MCCNTITRNVAIRISQQATLRKLEVFAAPDLATPGGFLRSCPCTTSEEEKGVWGVIESSVRLRRRRRRRRRKVYSELTQ